MKKFTAIEHTDRIVRSVSERADLSEFDLWIAVAKVMKSDSMQLRAIYLTELMHKLIDAEKAGA